MSRTEEIREAVNRFQNAADRVAIASSSLANLVLEFRPSFISDATIAREAATLIKHMSQTVRLKFEREEEKHSANEAVNTSLAPGLVRCQQCGEFKGTTLGLFLNWGEHSMHRSRESSITVTCLCHGSLCAHCKTHRIHRPGTNSYHERTNTIGYVPAFAGMRPCNSCEERDSAKSSEQEAAS